MIQIMSSPITSEPTIRALSSLTAREAAAVRATVRATGNRYRVDEHDDYDGYLSLLLTPIAQGRAAFLVSGRLGAIDLAALHGDDMVPMGSYPSIGAAMLALRPALESELETSPTSTARHYIDRHGADADLHAALRADATGDHRWHAVIRAIDATQADPAEEH